MKKFFALIASCAMVLSLCACGGAENNNSTPEASFSISEEPISVAPASTSTEDTASASDENQAPVIDIEGKYKSELTNEWIDEALMNQRPIAVMVDNEQVALRHYGTSKADIVYEMMNSTANGRITRLMCIFKDWESIEEIGNVRSARSTNVILAPEYNAILIHDGGPFYINEWFNYKNAKDHLSGGFARIDRGKANFYEEYATNKRYEGVGEYSGASYSSVKDRIQSAGIDLEYNQHYMGKHFQFSDEKYTLDGEANVASAELIDLPFPHNSSELKLNKETGLYDYYEYGDQYIDALYDSSLSFENLIIMCADYIQLDANGYLCYYAIGGDQGYFVTEGQAIPITWSKASMFDLTLFKNKATGEEITLNTGKTYIAIVPKDAWSQLVIK